MTTTISPLQNVTVTNSGSGYGSRAISGIGAAPYSVLTTGISKPTWTFSNSTSNLTAGELNLTGVNADITINGVSLMATLKLIQDRLNMLHPNPALENEWDQLRELGEQYRKLEAELVEKQRAWEILKRAE